MRIRPAILASLLPCLTATAMAQAVEPIGRDDRRDVVELKRGQPVTGRLVNPFDDDELLLLQGGKRVRIQRERVAKVTTVNDSLRALLELHAAAPDQPDRLWDLVVFARDKKLDAMASLLAYRVLTVDPDHAAAHELLGHRRHGERWLWRRDASYMPQDRFDAYVADWGHPLELAAEHWTLRTNAGVRRAVDTLLDLERLYLFLFERFGKRLDLYEVLRPIPVFAWKDADSFPGWTQLRIPYYHPPLASEQEGVFTFFAEDAGRADALFRVGTEAMLNRCLAVDATYVSVEDRLVDWFEVGFGQWIDSQLGGPPARMTATAPKLSPQRARLVLDERRYKLPILLTRNVDDHYYDSLTEYKEMDWAYAEAFVAFLMEDPQEQGFDDRLLHYAFQAMRKKRGDSSSTFDDAFDQRIEKLEKPFATWLAAKAAPASPIR